MSDQKGKAEEIGTDENIPIVIFKSTQIIKKYDIYFFEFTSDQHKSLATMCNVITNAEPSDEVNIYMNNNGGSCDTGYQLLNRINSSQCDNIKIFADAPVCSMAPVFLIAAARLGCGIQIGIGSYFMFHNFTGGIRGKGHEVFTQVNFYKEWAAKLDRDLLYPFLMDCEINYLLTGGDLYFDKTEVEARFKVLSKHIKKKITAKDIDKLEKKAESNLEIKRRECS